MAAAFVESGRRSPIIDTRGKTHTHIDRQTRGYKKDDPTTKHEKALPPRVFRHRMAIAVLPRERARAVLVSGALFFAMRSCEYTYVGKADRKTRAIRVCDIVFRNGAQVVHHDDPNLHLADTVDITFGDQKSNIKDETVSQDRTEDPTLNPVALYAETIQRVMNYPGAVSTWEIYTFHDGRVFTKISSKEILRDIRVSVDMIGKDILGFSSDDTGTHSVRASFAMMAYLAKEPIYTIMLIGRWSSDAFLAYIKKQIKEFTKGVSSRMLQHDTFYNIPLARDSRPDDQPNRGQNHHRRANLNIFGRQEGSLRHQLRPRS